MAGEFTRLIGRPVIVGHAIPAPCNVGVVGGRRRIDMEDGGSGRIVGTVKEKSMPANVPLKRRVVLLSMPGSRAIRETWSDPVSGAYEFREIAMDRQYTVFSYDHTGIYRAAVADNLTPEKM